jgi:hypothetical protein
MEHNTCLVFTIRILSTWDSCSTFESKVCLGIPSVEHSGHPPPSLVRGWSAAILN